MLEIRWGLIPDMCGTQFLPPLVGVERARELTWTGRTVTGREAVDIGLALRCADDPREDALALAADLAAKSPDAIRAGKRLFSSGRDALAAGFAAERAEIGALIGTPNQKEAVTAFFEKRSPQFR